MLRTRSSRSLRMRQAMALALLAAAPGVVRAADPAIDPAIGPTAPLARIGTSVLTEPDFGPSLSTALDKFDREYRVQMQQLELRRLTERDQTLRASVERGLNERVLALEAKAKRTTPEALLVGLKIAPVTDEEARRTYEEHRTEINRPYAEVEKPLRQQMNSERLEASRAAYFKSLREKYHARVLLDPLRLPVEPVGPTLGDPQAPISIVLFADFQCPYCAKIMPRLRDTVAKYPGRVRLVYRHMPLTELHDNAYAAALASVCADRQGKFWDTLTALYARPDRLAPPAIRETVTGLGVDGATYDECLRNGHPEAIVDGDAAVAERLGLSGTPSTLIDGRLLRGVVTLDTLADLIDDELTRIERAANRS